MTDIERRKHAAYWYAVGRVDAEGGPDLSDEFAAFAEAQAVAYYGDPPTSWFLASISEQWRQFLAHVRSGTLQSASASWQLIASPSANLIEAFTANQFTVKES